MATKCISPSYNRTVIDYRWSADQYCEADCPRMVEHGTLRSCLDSSLTPDFSIQLLPADSHMHHKSWKAVRNVVLAIRRLKMLSRLENHCFSDDDLLGLVLDYFVEEPVSFTENEESFRRDLIPPSFTQQSVIRCNIKDTDQKCLVVRDGNRAQLVAVHLQGPDSHSEVKINLSMYKSRSISRQPIALGIAGTNYYLSVTGDSSNPMLQLEKVESPESLKRISSQDMYRFIFYKSSQGACSRFESAAFPEWFIGTSQKTEEEVQMVSQRQDMFTTFMLS